MIHVIDEAAAEGELLREVLGPRGVKVESFGRKRQSLEETFLDLIEGDHEREG